MNGSLSVGGCGPREDPARFVLVPAAYAAALGLGLPANLAALAVFGRGERPARALRVYLLNLALADVLFTLTLPFWLTYYLGRAHWPFPEPSCRLAGAVYYLATYAALCFMTLIGLNRYCTVRGAGPRLPLNRARGARAACAAAWLLCLACATPSLASARAVRPGPGGSTRCFEHGWAGRGLAYATVGFFAASFLLVLAAYAALARALAAPPPGRGVPAGPHRRLARAVVLGLLLVFSVCLAPYHAILGPWVAGREEEEEEGAAEGCRPPTTLDVLHTLSLALLSLNSCLDPIVYCFSVRRFRQDCWRLGCGGRPGGGAAS
ncbi:platelet-activating factor receptor-like [Ornithorhynchus anatinus]|uniref:platelet-activating factor receptor-like n=1 Tax=Ornithorhynchus anatinus TaxID=9258 RepID=UPI0010A7DF8D|nr:platelet-activating factor receptor-like [Ornithorhynchus anatinus]